MRPRTVVLGLAGIQLLWAVAAQAEAPKSPPPDPPAASAAPGATRVAPGGATAKVPEKQLITMDFQDVEIGVLVKFISEITGKNFILDEKVRGKVTVISPTKISIDEAYRVFQSILEVKGFTTLPAGPVIKIVPVREAKEGGAPLAPKAATGDQYITQLVPLTFIDPSTLLPVLQPMVSKDGLISAYDAANTLVIIDTASNIERLLSIISELDIEMPARGIEMVHLENAYAENVAKTLQEVLEAQGERGVAKAAGAPAPAPRPAQPAAPGGAPGAATFKVIPDERTNSIIALASPSQMRMIRKLIKDLDKHLEGVSKIHVYALKYANATEMVQVLSDLVSGGGGAGGARGGTATAGLANTRRTTRQQQTQQQQQSFQSRTPGSRFGGTTGLLGGTAGGTGGAPGQGGPTAAVGGGGEFVGEVRITADPFTNSLIISAGAQDYDVLKRVIGELDIPRKQVYVEAIIFEISLDKSLQLGFEYQGGTQLATGVLGLGRLNFTNLNQALTTPQTLQGLVMAAVSNQTITLPDGTVVPAQVALFTALQNDRDVNVLSAPNILTSDNQEAEILVGQNVPFIASRATDTTNLANTFATVDRQDVGITLRLTPQISQGDVVRLDLYEEVSAIIPNPLVDANIAGPTTTVRSASTTVVARTGHTIVLGGLISDNAVSTQGKLPFIGDIPVLGNLFKQNADQRNKINLLIFLTPHVVHDDAELQALSLDERNQFKRYLHQEKLGPRHYEELNTPSWYAATATPAPGAPPMPAPGAAAAPSAAPPPPAIRAEPLPTPQEQAAVAPRPLAPPAPPAPIVPSSPSALGIPSTGHRFAVLLSVFEKGNAPPELQSTNGFVTVYMPIEAGEFFVKGGAYEYKSPTYEARYTCLEVFPDATTALSVYPEGQPLQRWGGAVVRWRPISAEQMRAMIAGASPWKRAR